MESLKEKDVFPGAIVRIEINEKFDGYALLLQPAGEVLTKINNDDSTVTVCQRWLVEFVEAGDKDKWPVVSEWFTQTSQAKVKTHRHVCYDSERSWESYDRKYGPLRERVYDNSKPDDNFEGEFGKIF